MQTLQEGRALVGWVSTVFCSLLRMTPGCVLAATLGFIMSQALLLMALILPWKILLFLSSGQFPASLPQFLTSYASREIMVALSVTALLAFLGHVLLDIACGVLIRRGAQNILSRHRKTGLFGSQQSMAAGFYRHIVRAFACSAACAIVIIALASLYPLMLIALLTCLIIGLAAIAIARRALPQSERHAPPGFLGRFWLGGGFLFLASWIVADYWRGHLLPLTVAFISLFLARQALVFTAQSVQSLQFLAKQRPRIDALFLAAVPWMPPAPEPDEFQALLARREALIHDLWEPSFGRDMPISAIQLRMAQAGKLAYLTATSSMGKKALLIKLFHPSLEAQMLHELEAMSVASADWPVPRLISHCAIAQHPCLVFEWDYRNTWLERRQRSLHLPTIRSRLLDCSLPTVLVERYDRSHPPLARRLADINWTRLRLLAPFSELAASCAVIQTHWAELLLQVSALPRQLTLPALAGRMMAAGLDDKPPVLCNWSGWRWEPVGSGWPITPEGQKALQSTLASYEGPRAELTAVDPEAAFRAALLHEMERSLARSNPVAALAAVKGLHASIVDHGLPGTVTRAIAPQSNSNTTALYTPALNGPLPC